MRKFSFLLSLIMLASCFSFSAFAVENTATMRWDDELSLTQSNGYPRMAQRADGRVLMTTDSGHLLYSDDRGASWTKHGTRVVANASTSATYTKDGTEYSFSGMTRANFQPFVLEDGTVFLGYRFHTNTGASGYTKGDPFYTSIRVMTSTDGGLTYSNEEILVEDVNIIPDNNGGTGHGFWEPFFLQIDENTIACYYADDLNIYKTGTNKNKHAQQRIAYVTYDIPTKTWDKTVYTAIYRGGENGISTRDGMPMATTLSDGTFAMVVEAQDFASWMKVGTNSTFVVGLSLSSDGRNWSDPVPVFGPKDLSAGDLCAAPSIATLPDGRIIITCQTDDSYTGIISSDATYNRAMAVAISDAPVTANTVLTAIDPANPKADGAAVGFTRVENVFNFGENVYCIWNAAFNCGNDVYLVGTAGTNNADNTRSGSHIRLRHLTAFANANEAANYDDVIARAGESKVATVYGTAESGTVTLGIPAGVSSDSVRVYRMDGGVYLTEMEATAANGSVSFTDDGGYYAVAGKELVIYGDANADGEVNLFDAVRLLKQLVSNVEGTDIAACDMDGSLSVDIDDAIRVLRKIVN